ncbi:Ankyrin repeat domain containing protein [Pandoravirus salinus]|uniref:Ankyrin repeat domain containing protein n=1 Tax=Pandoravirus salinus TaxID=1349410 RepID=S4W1K7_9VIRU|nr:ankyrin repeat domain [Pandoravirus salinus]AGO85691.1 Ankyrin repeat domain containing protein [Pandoravirus salinus]
MDDMLPDELLVRVLAFLPCAFQSDTCAFVCRRWHSVLSDRAAMGRINCQTRTQAPGSWGAARRARRQRHGEGIKYAVEWESGGVLCLENYKQQRVITYTLSRESGVSRTVAWRRRDRAPAACERAAAVGHTDCVVYAIGRGCCKSKRACNAAALYGRIDTIKWLLDQGFVVDPASACRAAVAGGHADCLAFVHARKPNALAGCNWADAIRRGHTDVVRYGHRHGYVPESSVSLAIEYNRNDILACLLGA